MTPREKRLDPPAAAEFAKRRIPVATERMLVEPHWFRLSTKRHADQFHPSPSCRLTPQSMTVPCCYLAPTKETTVAEIWGDAIDLERRAVERDPTPSFVFALSQAVAEGQAYLRVRLPFPSLQLCDLTDPAVIGATGFEKGALYHPDVRIPQTWAQLIVQHPSHFDGIIYRSRHTDDRCIVLFSQPGRRDLRSELAFDPAGEFRGSVESHRVAAHLGMRLAFV